MTGALATAESSVRTLPDSQGAMENHWLGQIALDYRETPEELMDALRAVSRERIMAAASSAKLDTVYSLKGIAAEKEDEE